MQDENSNKQRTQGNNYISRIASKIEEAENILVALSRDPSADEIAAAIGLTLFLDKMGKHATAIYSGETPNILQFLKPEETFETNTESLQDFIIALNKEKADHLRYKIDGDFVKVFITPYRTTITEDDLEFSRGDYNVDLVIALNVPTASDLDEALSEHGRILHDAAAVDITTSDPGRFGEIEWSDKKSSSVSEMLANLLLAVKTKEANVFDATVATALLAGIVSATNRFSNEYTFSSTMATASRLMDLGANQQLVALNLMQNSPVELIGAVDVSDNTSKTESEKKESEDPSRLDIGHSEESTTPVEEPEPTPEPSAVEPPAPDYGKMMEEALSEPIPGISIPSPLPTESITSTPAASTQPPNEAPIIESPETIAAETAAMDNTAIENPAMPVVGSTNFASTNPAAAAAPNIATPENQSSLPEMQFTPEPTFVSQDNPQMTPGSELMSAPESAGDDFYLIEEPKTTLSPDSAAEQPAPQIEQPTPQIEQPISQSPIVQPVSLPEPVLPMPGDINLPPPPMPPVNFDGAPIATPVDPLTQPMVTPGANFDTTTNFDAVSPQPEIETPILPPVQAITSTPDMPTPDPSAFQIPGA